MSLGNTHGDALALAALKTMVREAPSHSRPRTSAEGGEVIISDLWLERSTQAEPGRSAHGLRLV
ncbi:MAG: hypothetical protein CMH57_15075 [Myxococcales bacterium]|nr:hypothetical protein [Myxococcales bacterium]